MQSKPMLTGLAAVLALLSVACGSSTQSAGGSTPATVPTPASTGATVAVATSPKYGQILVDGKGISLYMFVADAGTQSTCYSSCAAIWPPLLTTGAPQAISGAQATLLGTTTRTDGKVEVTYAGHPLYYFFKDKASGDTLGQGVDGFGALWWVMAPSGALITTK
jgi:predicted lipoprotein with Yx(FWY)xxD motif